MRTRMTNKDALYFDNKLWAEIRECQNNTSPASLTQLAQHMRNKFPKEFSSVDRNKVDSALTRLETRGMIDRGVKDGKYYTKALEQAFYERPDNSFFIDEKPVPVTTKAIAIYNYFVDNRVIGKNRVAMAFLAKWFEISERDVRKIIERINFHGYKFGPNQKPFEFKIQGNVNPAESGYSIVDSDYEMRRFIRRYDQMIYKASRKARRLREDWGNDGQMQQKLRDLETDILFVYEQEFEEETRRSKALGDEIQKLPVGLKVDSDNIDNKLDKEELVDENGNPLPF